MPTPTTIRFKPFSRTPREQICFPTMAATVSTAAKPRILAVSVPGGYQWADVPAMRPSVVVVTDNYPELARGEAQRLSEMLWALRDKLDFTLWFAVKPIGLAPYHLVERLSYARAESCFGRLPIGNDNHPGRVKSLHDGRLWFAKTRSP